MENITMCDVIIIGKGPAGISASLYAVRAGLNVIVIGKDSGSLGKASRIENYYGFDGGINASELFENGIKGAERLGVHVITDEVFEIENMNGLFHITSSHGIYESAVCILAAGSSRKTLPIKGLSDYEGKGVSQLVKEQCDYVASIPMKGKIGSLNASVAAGVLAYEIVRQRGLT